MHGACEALAEGDVFSPCLVALTMIICLLLFVFVSPGTVLCDVKVLSMVRRCSSLHEGGRMPEQKDVGDTYDCFIDALAIVLVIVQALIGFVQVQHGFF